jgi:hypothetical protein
MSRIRTTATILNIDPLSQASITRAIEVLKALHDVATTRVNTFGEDPNIVRAELAEFHVSLPESEAPAESTPIAAPTSDDPVFGPKIHAFFTAMMNLIRQTRAPVTLEEVAAKENIDIETARAFLRNAGRTVKAKGLSLPVKRSWDADKRCNLYSLP